MQSIAHQIAATSADATAAMIRADKICAGDQNWQEGSTTWTFADGSQLHVQEMDFTAKNFTTTDYHGATVPFKPGDKVTHVTDDGQHYPGTIKEIADGLLHLTYPDGQEGWEEPATCFHG